MAEYSLVAGLISVRFRAPANNFFSIYFFLFSSRVLYVVEKERAWGCKWEVLRFHKTSLDKRVQEWQGPNTSDRRVIWTHSQPTYYPDSKCSLLTNKSILIRSPSKDASNVPSKASSQTSTFSTAEHATVSCLLSPVPLIPYFIAGGCALPVTVIGS